MNTSSTDRTPAASPGSRIAPMLAALRETYPEVGSITGEVIEGRVVDGFSIEVQGYYGADLIEVNASTAAGAATLMLAELERARSAAHSHEWPTRLDN